MPGTNADVFYICSCHGEVIHLSDWKAIYPDTNDEHSLGDDLIISIWTKGLRVSNKRSLMQRLKLAIRFFLKDDLYTDEIILNKDAALSMAGWIYDRYYEIPEDLINSTVQSVVDSIDEDQVYCITGEERVD